MATVKRPEILLLSLEFQSFFDELYSSLIDNLNRSAQLKRTKLASSTIKYLEENNPRAILVTDAGLAKSKFKAVREKVLSYIHNGGLVIIGQQFPSSTTTDVFDGFWSKTFDLPWRRGDYHRSDFQLNPSCSLPTGVALSRFPEPYSMKVNHVKNARAHEKIFVAGANAMTQSNVSPPGPVDQEQAAVVGAYVGNGYVVYVGDVNAEEGTVHVILSLCGL